MKKNNVYLVFLALLFTAGLQAQQVTLKTADMVVAPGANVHLDVQVEDFEVIIGTQFSINWDPAVLEYISVDNFGLPNVSLDGNFGAMDVSEGKLRFIWYQQELTGVTLDDMSTIFSVWFKAVGDPSTSSQVMITSDPIDIEIVDPQGVVPYVVNNGTVTIEGANASNETITQDFILFQNSPNPFTDITYISFNLQQPANGQLVIHNGAGKVIFQQNGVFNTGLNRIPVSRDLFQTAGSYFYTLKTKRAVATRQLIAQ